jgi:RNA polymerase sigma-70 factor, ECF subfamily
MTLPTDDVNRALEEYRVYLERLKNIQIDPLVRQKFGMSDIVQVTLVEAGRDLDRIQAMDPAGRKRWLRRIFMNNLLDELRKFLNRPPEVSIDEPLRVAAEESSCRVQNWVAVEDTSPSEKMINEDEGDRLLEALAQIDPRQREALILQKWQGWKLEEIAEHMGCTTGAVAGLHARGLKALRKLLPDME